MRKDYLFTSESVTEGHPDKMADQISDAILDEMLRQDKYSRVACETLVTTGMVFVSGEITTKGYVEMPDVIRQVVKEIGYRDASQCGFDSETCGITLSIDRQATDIACGVNAGEGLFKEQGAGDQGIMFGYATDENEDFMPTPVNLAHQLCYRLAEVRKNKILPFILPDGKSQVSVRYENGYPVAVDKVVVSTQHKDDVTHDTVKDAVMYEVIKKIIPEKFLHSKTQYFVNPTGRFVMGGPVADTGLTGRKIIVDTYGGIGRHGGGAFSGKDPSKVDRSASYMARYAAKNIVAAGLAKKCEIQIAYAIGVAEPVSVYVNTFGTIKNNLCEENIENAVRKTFDLRPAAIIDELDLLNPIYRQTAAYGHFGRDGRSWERKDKVDKLKSICL